MTRETWKVGELAESTGLSVRTLHHYDEIGLLTPSRRTPSGHRLYGTDDVIRLQQIVSLRQLGFSLDEIGVFLDRPDASPRDVIQLHLARLTKQLEAQRSLHARLSAIADRLQSRQAVAVADFIQVIKEVDAMEKIDKYYTDEQRAWLAERRKLVGEERIRESQVEWKELIESVRAEMDRGTDPTSEPVLKLARKWVSLIEEFTGGNAGITRSLANMYSNEPTIANDYGVKLDARVFEYIGRAMRAAQGDGS